MNALHEALAAHAARRPDAPAVGDATGTLGYAALWRAVTEAAAGLRGDTLGLWLDNGPAWIALDVAAQLNGMAVAPIPGFFSAGQVAHVLRRADVDCLAIDDARRGHDLADYRVARTLVVGGRAVRILARVARSDPSHGPVKLTFTSGTTGNPKGVRLGHARLIEVAAALRAALAMTAGDRSLSLLPLATLLENVAVYAVLLAGGCAMLPPLAATGVAMDGVDAVRLVRVVERHPPTGLVLVPQLLLALVRSAEAGWRPPPGLRFAAVGGAHVAPELIGRAREAGLPAYEGYGLTEACSVVCLNRPGADRPGSVGRVLSHSRIRIADDGEVWVGGALLEGYLGEAPWRDRWFPTGDIGRIDGDGYLHLAGRKDHLIVTAFGRNLSPEWPERELLAESAIRQAVVFGHGRARVVALIVPDPGRAHEVPAAVRRVNERLPNYARIANYHLAGRPLDLAHGELTANGRPRRAVIGLNFEAALAALHREELNVVLP